MNGGPIFLTSRRYRLKLRPGRTAVRQDNDPRLEAAAFETRASPISLCRKHSFTTRPSGITVRRAPLHGARTFSPCLYLAQPLRRALGHANRIAAPGCGRVSGGSELIPQRQVQPVAPQRGLGRRQIEPHRVPDAVEPFDPARAGAGLDDAGIRVPPSEIERRPRLCREVERRLLERWSPPQIAARLVCDSPDDREMRVSHETIYRSLFVQARVAPRTVPCPGTGRVT